MTLSEEVLLAHPLKLRAIASARIKNDRIDSEVLAHLLRANLIPAAHAPSRDIRALRRVLRQRMFNNLGQFYSRPYWRLISEQLVHYNQHLVGSVSGTHVFRGLKSSATSRRNCALAADFLFRR